MITVEGRGNIRATVIADSVNQWGDRVTTFQLHYPRFIHSEFMTHRMVSKNASSSRAIPTNKQIEFIRNNTAMPIHWGANKPGMQADVESDASVMYMTREDAWKSSCDSAIKYAEAFNEAGYHKQIINRIIEPYTFMNVVATATDWENFFWLRYHRDAQPEICELARVMYEAREQSEPMLLYYGEWHLPYVDSFRDSEGMLQYVDCDRDEVYTLDEAIKISASSCAQVSYRSLDTSLEKAIRIFERLVGSEPIHASPFEHQCTPYSVDEYSVRVDARKVLRDGLINTESAQIVEVDKLCEIVMYTGNFRGWTQFRKTIKNENMIDSFSPKKS